MKRDDARRRRERVPLEYAAAGDLFPVTPTGIGGAARGDGEQALALDVRNLLRTRATFRRLRRVQCGDVDAVVGRRVCFLRGLRPRGFAARRYVADADEVAAPFTLFGSLQTRGRTRDRDRDRDPLRGTLLLFSRGMRTFPGIFLPQRHLARRQQRLQRRGVRVPQRLGVARALRHAPREPRGVASLLRLRAKTPLEVRIRAIHLLGGALAAVQLALLARQSLFYFCQAGLVRVPPLARLARRLGEPVPPAERNVRVLAPRQQRGGLLGSPPRLLVPRRLLHRDGAGHAREHRVRRPLELQEPTHVVLVLRLFEPLRVSHRGLDQDQLLAEALARRAPRQTRGFRVRVVRPRVRRPPFPAERQPRLLPFRRFEIRRENATVRARIRRGGRRLRPRARPSVRRGVVPASVERPLRRAFALSVGFVHLPPRALHLGDETRQLPPLARQTRRGEIALSRQDGSLSCRSPDRVRLRRARRAGSCGLLDLNLRERLGRAGVLRPRVFAARRRRRSKRRKLLRLFFFFFLRKGCFDLEVLLLVQRVQLPLHVLHAPRELADGRLRAVPARQNLRERLLRAARALVPPRRRILLIRIRVIRIRVRGRREERVELGTGRRDGGRGRRVVRLARRDAGSRERLGVTRQERILGSVREVAPRGRAVVHDVAGEACVV